MMTNPRIPCWLCEVQVDLSIMEDFAPKFTVQEIRSCAQLFAEAGEGSRENKLTQFWTVFILSRKTIAAERRRPVTTTGTRHQAGRPPEGTSPRDRIWPH